MSLALVPGLWLTSVISFLKATWLLPPPSSAATASSKITRVLDASQRSLDHPFFFFFFSARNAGLSPAVFQIVCDRYDSVICKHDHIGSSGAWRDPPKLNQTVFQLGGGRLVGEMKLADGNLLPVKAHQEQGDHGERLPHPLQTTVHRPRLWYYYRLSRYIKKRQTKSGWLADSFGVIWSS